MDFLQKLLNIPSFVGEESMDEMYSILRFRLSHIDETIYKLDHVSLDKLQNGKEVNRLLNRLDNMRSLLRNSISLISSSLEILRFSKIYILCNIFYAILNMIIIISLTYNSVNYLTMTSVETFILSKIIIDFIISTFSMIITSFLTDITAQYLSFNSVTFRESETVPIVALLSSLFSYLISIPLYDILGSFINFSSKNLFISYGIFIDNITAVSSNTLCDVIESSINKAPYEFNTSTLLSTLFITTLTSGMIHTSTINAIGESITEINKQYEIENEESNNIPYNKTLTELIEESTINQSSLVHIEQQVISPPSSVITEQQTSNDIDKFLTDDFNKAFDRFENVEIITVDPLAIESNKYLRTFQDVYNGINIFNKYNIHTGYYIASKDDLIRHFNIDGIFQPIDDKSIELYSKNLTINQDIGTITYKESDIGKEYLFEHVNNKYRISYKDQSSSEFVKINNYLRIPKVLHLLISMFPKRFPTGEYVRYNPFTNTYHSYRDGSILPTPHYFEEYPFCLLDIKNINEGKKKGEEIPIYYYYGLNFTQIRSFKDDILRVRDLLLHTKLFGDDDIFINKIGGKIYRPILKIEEEYKKTWLNYLKTNFK